jgi:hypothetical protein
VNTVRTRWEWDSVAATQVKLRPFAWSTAGGHVTFAWSCRSLRMLCWIASATRLVLSKWVGTWAAGVVDVDELLLDEPHALRTRLARPAVAIQRARRAVTHGASGELWFNIDAVYLLTADTVIYAKNLCGITVQRG